MIGLDYIGMKWNEYLFVNTVYNKTYIAVYETQ